MNIIIRRKDFFRKIFLGLMYWFLFGISIWLMLYCTIMRPCDDPLTTSTILHSTQIQSIIISQPRSDSIRLDLNLESLFWNTSTHQQNFGRFVFWTQKRKNNRRNESSSSLAFHLLFFFVFLLKCKVKKVNQWFL